MNIFILKKKLDQQKFKEYCCSIVHKSFSKAHSDATDVSFRLGMPSFTGMMFTVLTVGWIPVFMAVALYKTFRSNKVGPISENIT